MKTKIIIPLLLLLAVTGCTIVNHPNRNAQQQQTQLQTRQYQQREFDTNDVKLIMKAVLNTLQDDGFIVKNAVVDLGLLSATKEISLKGSSQGTTQNSNDDFWTIIFRDAIAGRRGAATPRNEPVRYQNLKQIEATINVSEFGKQTRVRASFQARILDNEGNVMESYPIDDMKFYQDFFVKVDKGVFIQKQKF